MVRLATQLFPKQLVSADTIYKALITGCALTGPNGCAAASEGDGPLDIDAKVQALLKTAYDATKLNASVPLTSGDIRSERYVLMLFNLLTDSALQLSCSPRCMCHRSGTTS